MSRTIHVLTVHWQSPKWIEPQHNYLARNIASPYKTYAFLTGIDDSYKRYFDFVDPRNLGDHAKKLNLLAEYAITQADSDDDILLFLDGDAFPLRPVAQQINNWLEEYPLAAVQRLENNGDIQPHPCFCVTTVGLWKRIEGDWSQGHLWLNNDNEKVTDVGGNLLAKLEKQQLPWLRLNRSNTINTHPLWYGIYGGLIYHHGAGFRPAVSRVDLAKKMNRLDRLLERFRQHLPETGLLGRLNKKLDPIGRFADEISRENQASAEKIYQQICSNPEFYQQFE